VRTIDDYHLGNIIFGTLLYPILFHNTSPHSHSILSMRRNTLIYKRKKIFEW
jgi:hypothetical protein